MDKVKIVSKTKSPISVKVADIHFSREWAKEGAFVNIDREQLDELMYDNGFRYMIDSGMLYIEDMQVKKELGLEPEDAEKPVNIIALSDEDKKRYMTMMPIYDFKPALKKLKYEQLLALADYAIEHEIGDFQKAEEIKKACGKDIITAIKLNRQDKED